MWKKYFCNRNEITIRFNYLRGYLKMQVHAGVLVIFHLKLVYPVNKFDKVEGDQNGFVGSKDP